MGRSSFNCQLGICLRAKMAPVLQLMRVLYGKSDGNGMAELLHRMVINCFAISFACVVCFFGNAFQSQQLISNYNTYRTSANSRGYCYLCFSSEMAHDTKEIVKEACTEELLSVRMLKRERLLTKETSMGKTCCRMERREVSIK